MIYYMDGKTFMTKYINEDPDRILRTQYVIVSSTIRKTGDYEKQVLNANNLLFPNSDLIFDYKDYNSNSYKEAYINYIDNSKVKSFIAKLIEFTIENENIDIIFLCGEKELKYNYFKILKLYVSEEFGFKILKWKGKKVDINESYIYSKDSVKNICADIIKDFRKESIEKSMSNDFSRKKVLKNMSKKDLQKLCKSNKILFSKNMSKSDLRNLLDAYY